MALYKKIYDSKNLRNYSVQVIPIIKSFGGKPLVKGGEYRCLEGEDFQRTVIWEFPSFSEAVKCHDSKEYQAGWAIAKDTTERNLQIIEGFNTE